MSDNNVVGVEDVSTWHVCGLVVQAELAKIEQVKQALLAIEQTEIPMIEETKGKLVVVMQSEDQQQLLDNMEKARDLEGVLDLSLIYHEQDA
ncbi:MULTISPECIES: chaperone NapD [Glaesserella]|uniref:Chaperone NapD n=1 Tax=Glaesserella australis TaxID=2094024 RepID=A0A328BWP9_9PAST|nr:MULTISPECIES: chaperone NapD [Glaesserella]AUI66574.1 nitrate reductase [Glaesserella sp. 15-184]RAL18748.1 nitrate reductase [Glaesserella australis]